MERFVETCKAGPALAVGAATINSSFEASRKQELGSCLLAVPSVVTHGESMKSWGASCGCRDDILEVYRADLLDADSLREQGS